MTDPKLPPAGDDEVWLPLVGFEGHYEISSYGRILSYVRAHHVDGSYSPKLLRPFICNGYPIYELKGKKYRAHRLVALTFIGPAPEGQEDVNHIDGVRGNSKVDNLEWVNPSQNYYHAVSIGLIPKHPPAQKGRVPWNKGKKTGRAAPFDPNRQCSVCGQRGKYCCRQLCRPCYLRAERKARRARRAKLKQIMSEQPGPFIG